eukprot:1149099-Pelagomonas_calceolata.AAC.2
MSCLAYYLRECCRAKQHASWKQLRPAGDVFHIFHREGRKWFTPFEEGARRASNNAREQEEDERELFNKRRGVVQVCMWASLQRDDY